MKLIKEHINEKFTEDSDPIKDMGIGITLKSIEKWMNEETKYSAIAYSKDYYLAICTFYGKINFITYLIDSLGFDVNVSESLALRVAILDYKGENRDELIEFLVSKGAYISEDYLKNKQSNKYDILKKYVK